MGFDPAILLTLGLAVPLVAAAAILALGRVPAVRDAALVAGAVALFAVVALLTGPVVGGARPELEVAALAPGLDLAFAVEPLGMLFALVAATLWLANSVYAISYMRANREARQTPFHILFAVALAATMGIAFAKNLFTLFLFYEVLTLSTYPLVAHRGTPAAIRGGRIYLLTLLATSIGLLLPAIAATGILAGTLDFAPGGILAGKAEGPLVGVLLAAFVFGTGKAAVMPVHFWLPAAMVAPTPVSALLHAVAVVKAGVFTILKVIVGIFGVDFLAASGAGDWLVWVAAFTVVTASAMALRQTNFKRMLAYSTIGQLSYVILAAAILTPISVAGAALHIAAHAVAKITLFFVAGAVHTATHIEDVRHLDGIGRRMPWTMAAFAIGALSMIGVPPTAGFLSKWLMLSGGMEAGAWVAVAAIVVSTGLNAGYFLPVIFRAFFRAPAAGHDHEHGDDSGPGPRVREAPWPMVLALAATAAGTLALFFFPGTPFRLATLVGAE